MQNVLTYTAPVACGMQRIVHYDPPSRLSMTVVDAIPGVPTTIALPDDAIGADNTVSLIPGHSVSHSYPQPSTSHGEGGQGASTTSLPLLIDFGSFQLLRKDVILTHTPLSPTDMKPAFVHYDIATSYHLNGLVGQERPLQLMRDNLLEYRGSLQPTGKIATIKRIRFASEPTNEVFSVIVLVIYVDCFPLALNLAPTRPRQHSPLPWDHYGVQHYNINRRRVYSLGKRVWLCQKSWSQSGPFGTSLLMSLYPCAHFRLRIQLHGLARAISYLHTHSSGPIFHGDVKGVRFLNLMYRFHAGILTLGKHTNWRR